MKRLRVALYGAVQGVGFRPFVYRLATELGLKGTVLNSSAGLVVEAEGERTDEFLDRLESEHPAAAVVLAREVSILPLAGYKTFEILKSDAAEEKTAAVLPDLATCPDCLRELSDPADRRHGYAFTNCTQCGPRHSIILDIPYDRPNTTMRQFEMCDNCRAEYTDPANRRFHAQPNACPVCGPRLALTESQRSSEVRQPLPHGRGPVTVTEPRPAASARLTEPQPPGSGPVRAESPIHTAASALARGEILALKGIGGFQLIVDARNEQAVARLRRLKRREEKPFALMIPSIAAVRESCELSGDEERVLRSSASPIVLLRPRPGAHAVAPNVAHNSPYLGVMLPYSPLHHLLMREFPYPIVATSGNLSDEPIATDNSEAFERLSGMADVFLVHDRPIARPVDDSVVRVIRGRESVVRRARGYAPLPVRTGRELRRVLAVGAHLKSTVAVAAGRQVFLSQHIGDLDTHEARIAFERAIADLARLYRFEPEIVACDLHPDYASTHWALAQGLPVVRVQHHQAHVAACAAENDIRGPYLGVSWDGAGYGSDATIWGGEFFLAADGGFDRIAHLRRFRLPGGEAAIKEGWRSAAAIRWELGRTDGTPPLIARMLERGVNSPLTSSVGRLFDAVSALAGVAQESRFEGQAAMLLERAIDGFQTADAYPLPGGDWAPLIDAVEWDVRAGAAQGLIAARFHNALANWILEVAEQSGVHRVCLSGGVFQNGYLVERAASLLESRGFEVFTHQRVPANDGGIALGQAVIASLP